MIRTICYGIWAVIALMVVWCEVISIYSSRRIPGFVRMLETLAARPYRTAVLFVGWMWIGWHFFAR
jgi:hypothetical protein